MNRAVAIAGLLLVPMAEARAQLPADTEQPDRWQRAEAAQRAFEHRTFTDAGFPSIAQTIVEGRTVRRLLLHDPYGMLPVPGVELEQFGDGRVTLRLQYQEWSADPVFVDRAAWDALARQEQAVFAAPETGPARPGSEPSAPPPSCHGWIARLEADYQRTASWAQCGGSPGPAYDYAVAIARLAIESKPGCTFDQADPFWSFNTCFAPSPDLEDPALQSTFSALRREYEEAPGAARLSEARQALNAPGMAFGNQAWRDARAAVARYKAVHELQRERLRGLQQLAWGAQDASAADTARMRQTIQAWSQFLDSQVSNYADLLQRLVWAEGIPTAG